MGIKKSSAGVLSCTNFLFLYTSRQLQRWRDGEGASVTCLHHDDSALYSITPSLKEHRVAPMPDFDSWDGLIGAA
jgi:hypothetical protein